MESFDAIVIGGGPAGGATSLFLARAGWSVALVERRMFPRRKVCGEYLSPTNWAILRSLGLLEPFLDLAGPDVRQTAIFVRDQQVRAALPQPAEGLCWGRALSREYFDTLLLERAKRHGVHVLQPASCTALRPEREFSVCTVENHGGQGPRDLRGRLVVAAHGSWQTGELPTHPQQKTKGKRDWLAFKAHFGNAALPAGLMPLLSFPDGYGGMVHCDGGRTSLSCCLRRSRFEHLKRRAGQSAGEAVFEHLLATCPVLQPIFESATLDDAWLSAGPIRPGIRARYREGVYVVGNAAGEAHPVVAEGISMALQSAWLLAERLIPRREDLGDPEARQSVGRSYAAAWSRAFAPRIRAATAVAHWAERPAAVAATLPLVRLFPTLLTWGARLCGKSKMVVPALTEAYAA